ncbi:MAG: glycosyltransferase [Nitrospiraceae bacterium]
MTVLIDGEDDSDIRCDLYRRYRCRLYFKREYRWMPGGGVAAGLARRFAFRHCSEVSTSIFPLPFSVIPGVASPSLDPPRDVDVSYVVRASHPKRIRAYTLLRAATDLKTETAVYADASDRQSKLQTGLPKVWTKLRGDALATEAQRAARLPYDAYRHLLARSKMALSVRGGGFDTLRYWEIVSSKALLVSETPDILIPNNFESGKHALFCKPDLSDLVPLIRRYVHEDAARGAMVDAAYAHLHAHHTCSHRARYLLDLVRQYA